MAGRGVHFGIDDITARRLRTAEDDDALMAVVEEIEEAWQDGRVFEMDKAWSALRYAFPDGPLDLVFFGADVLTEGEDYWINLLSPAQVAAAASALATVDRATLRGWYDAIDPADHDRRDDEDFEYTWSSFEGLPAYFGRMAEAGLHVVFTVDV